MKKKHSNGMVALGCLGVLAYILVNIALMYVLVPFILVKLLAVFGVVISFYLAMGIVFVVHFIAYLVKGL